MKNVFFLAVLFWAWGTAGMLLGANEYGKLPANTFVKVTFKTLQPKDPASKGKWMNVGWNKLVYDKKGKRILFNDRWFDKKHGGYTIYGNCVFSFDPKTKELKPLKISNWKKEGKGGGYITVMLEENQKEPTPVPRHVYNAFTLDAERNQILLSNGANQGATAGGKRGHTLSNDTWSFDLKKLKWLKIISKKHPSNSLEDGMAVCSTRDCLVYVGHGRIWILEFKKGQWRESKVRLKGFAYMGMTVHDDPKRKRVLLTGGGNYGKSAEKGKGFNDVYAFDPKTEKLTKLADCPTAMVRSPMAYDEKHDVFLMSCFYKKINSTQPNGLYAYHPKSNKWEKLKADTSALYKGSGKQGPRWMPLCYDNENEVFWAMFGPAFFAFRYVPEKK